MKIVRKIGKWIGNIFIGGFGLVIAIFAFKFLCYLLLIGMCIFNAVFGGEQEMQYLYDFDIESMEDNHTYVVSRYGGDEELKYYFVREMDGQLHTGNTDADESSIVEDGQNKVEVFAPAPEYGTKIYNFLDKLASMDGEPMARKEYVYHIPTGSVEQGEFNVDLE